MSVGPGAIWQFKPTRSAQLAPQNTRSRHIMAYANRNKAGQVLDGKRVAVVGGGPAGMLTAAHMANLGALVDVYEKHDSSKVESSSSRSFRSGWLILLGAGVKEVIESAGISSDMGAKNRFMGGRSAGEDGAPSFWGEWTQKVGQSEQLTPLCLASRLTIAEHIRGECERVHGSKVTVHAGRSLSGGDPAAGKLTFQASDGAEVAVQADLVVGADGVNSATRQLMLDQDPSMTMKTDLCVTKTITTFLSTLGGPLEWSKLPTASGKPYERCVPPGVDKISGSSMHVFMPAAASKADAVAFWVNSGLGGQETSVALTASPGFWAEAKTEAEALDWLETTFPQAPKVWLEEAAAACAEVFQGNTHNLRQHKFVELNKLGSGRAVLVGDAAHAMSPHLGMGCNNALSDALALSEAVKVVHGDVYAVAAEFTAARLPQVAAVMRLTRHRCNIVTFPMHKRLVDAALSYPIYITQLLGFLRMQGKIPNWLLPGEDTMSLHSGTPPLQVEQAMRKYMLQVAGGAAAVGAVVLAVLVKITAQA